MGYWQYVFDKLAHRQNRYDSRMIREYARRADLARYDVRYLFSPGDRVLLKQKRPGKLNVKALGPYIFVRYTGPLHVTAVIADGTGRKLPPVSVANLLPVHAGSVVRVDAEPTPGELDGQQQPQQQQERQDWEEEDDLESAGWEGEPRAEEPEDSDFGPSGPGLDARGNYRPRRATLPSTASLEPVEETDENAPEAESAPAHVGGGEVDPEGESGQHQGNGVGPSGGASVAR